MQLNDTCPVCGMKAEVEVPSVEHDKIYVHFCSEQCRETFIAHPRLYNPKTREERNTILKRRTMHLAESLNSEVTALLIPYLNGMMGVKKVVVDGEKLAITYDLLQVTENHIEQALVEIGVQLGDGWLERLRRGWVHNSEETVLDNLASPPAPRYNHTPQT